MSLPSRGRADVSRATDRTIARMDARTFDARELILPVVLLVGISRLVDPPFLWGIALLVGLVTAVGALQLLGAVDPAAETTGVPVESLLVPAVAALAAVGAIRLVPIGLWLVPWLAIAGLLLDRTLSTEAGLLATTQGTTAETRTAVMGAILVVAFVAFLGAAAAIPGGLPDPAGALAPSAGIRLRNLAVLTGADALIGGLLGYRAAALRGTRLRDVFWSAITCAVVVAIAAAGLRALAIPRLMGPALLVIVLYLWDAAHAAVRSNDRDVRRIWEALMLAAAAIVVIVWSFNVSA